MDQRGPSHNSVIFHLDAAIKFPRSSNQIDNFIPPSANKIKFNYNSISYFYEDDFEYIFNTQTRFDLLSDILGISADSVDPNPSGLSCIIYYCYSSGRTGRLHSPGSNKLLETFHHNAYFHGDVHK